MYCPVTSRAGTGSYLSPARPLEEAYNRLGAGDRALAGLNLITNNIADLNKDVWSV